MLSESGSGPHGGFKIREGLVRASMTFVFPEGVEAGGEGGGFTNPALNISRVDLGFSDEGAVKLDRDVIRNPSRGQRVRVSDRGGMLDAKGDSGSLSLADVHGRDGGVKEGSVSLGRRSEKTIEAR
jgi:hypothetical protein